MRKLQKSNRYHTFPPIRWLDGYLTSWKHWWIAVAVVTVVFVLIYSINNLIPSFILSIVTVWTYMSCRKYGVMDTMVFVGVFPFLLLAAVTNLLPISPGSDVLDYETFIEAALEEIERAYNEVYVGKIIDTRTEEEKIYITVETPYGLHVPVSEMIAEIAKQLRITPGHIQVDPISDGRMYYVFGLEAVKDYEESKKTTTPFKSFADIKDRIFCKSPATVTQRSLRESHSF